MEKFDIKQILNEHISVAQAFIKESGREIEHLGGALAVALDNNQKVLICGNGGSASDSSHFAAELVGRFEKERRALPVISLTTDSSILTAIANDYYFEDIFSKQVEALGNKNDILIAISTSGKSPNIIKAMKIAKKQNMLVVLLTGEKGRKNKVADIVIDVPSSNTARIQECHILFVHIVSKIIEDYFFEKEANE